MSDEQQMKCYYASGITPSEAARRAEAESSLVPAIGSAPVLTRKVVALEGRLELERIPFHPPAECRHSCDMRLTPWLCGLARTEGGATNIAVLEMYLESLNGKYVRVTIEAEEQNP